MLDVNDTLNPGYTQDGEKRLRTKVACDYCRKRKSKCNGEQPCSKCLDKNRNCTYTFVQKERKRKQRKPTAGAENKNNGAIRKARTTSAATIRQLTSRINVLESLLGRLVDRLDPNVKSELSEELQSSSFTNGNNDSREKHNGSSSNSSDNGDDEENDFQEAHEGGDSDDKNNSDGSVEYNHNDENSKQIDTKSSNDNEVRKLRDMLAPAEKSCVSNIKNRLMQYFGSHALFFSISGRAVEWLRSRVQGSNANNMNDIFAPLRHVPLSLNDAVQKSTKLLNGPDVETDKKRQFDDLEKSLIFEIIDKYYKDLYWAPFLCDVSTIRELFQIYFYGAQRNDAAILGNITYSDLLIMNIALVLCLANISRDDVIDSLEYPNLSTKSISYLQSELLNKLFQNAMGAYGKVSRNSDGIRSLQGLALLILYFEINFVTDFHVNYSITSVLIRYAKELGIHRVETLNNDNGVEATLKRKLWWFCEYKGVDITYKSGKPILIDMDDVTTLTEVDDFFMSVPTTLFLDGKYLENANDIVLNSQIHGGEYYFAYFLLILSRIKAKSYAKIYSKLPTNINIQAALTFVNEFDYDLRILTNLMLPILAATTTISSPNSTTVKNPLNLSEGCFNYFKVELLLSQYAHQLSINRVPFVKSFGINDSRLIPYGNQSLAGARSMLELIKDIGLLKISQRMYSALSFYPLAAFCSLLGNCLVFPSEPSAVDDSVLLANVAISFFGLEGCNNKIDNKRSIYDILVRLLLRVLIDALKNLAKVDLYEKIPKLEYHINSMFTLFPEVFANQQDQIISLMSERNSNNENANQHSNMIENGSSSIGCSSSSTSSSNTIIDSDYQKMDLDVKNSTSLPQSFMNTPGMLNIDNGNMMLMNGNYDLFSNINFENIMSDETFNNMIFSELNELPDFFNSPSLGFNEQNI